MEVKFSDFKIIPLMDSITRSDMDDREYFSSKYSHCLSNSRLKYIDPEEEGSPELYKNPPHITTQSLTIGSGIHECLLQKDSFRLAPKMEKPTAKLGMVADYVYEHRSDDIPIEDTIREASQKIGYYVNSIDSKINSIIEKCTPYWEKLDEPRSVPAGIKEVILSDNDHDTVENCLKSCFSNPSIMDKLNPTDAFGEPYESYNEIAFFIDFLITYKGKQCTTLRFKMKADNYTVDEDSKLITVNDLKTTGHPVNWFMNSEYGSLVHYHYYRQAYLYSWILWLYCSQKYGATKETGWKMLFHFLVVQTFPDYSSKCYKLNNTWLKKGKKEAEELLIRVAAQQIFGWKTNIKFV